MASNASYSTPNKKLKLILDNQLIQTEAYKFRWMSRIIERHIRHFHGVTKSFAVEKHLGVYAYVRKRDRYNLYSVALFYMNSKLKLRTMSVHLMFLVKNEQRPVSRTINVHLCFH